VASDGMAADGNSHLSPSGTSSYAAGASLLRSVGSDTVVTIPVPSVNMIIAGRQFSSYMSFSPDKWRLVFVPCHISVVIALLFNMFASVLTPSFSVKVETS
jgi:hypothetical protein